MLKQWAIYAMLLFVILFLINSFFAYIIPIEFMGTVVLLAIILSYSDINKNNGYLSLGLFLAGSFFFVKEEAGYIHWFKALTDNGNLVSLILTVPLMGIPLSYGLYQEEILEISRQKIKSQSSFYFITAFVFMCFGMFLNLAAIPLVDKLMRETSEEYPKKLYIEAMTRGIHANLLWSPNFVSVATAINYVGLSWFAVLPVGLSLALLEAILSVVFKLKLIYGQKKRDIKVPGEDNNKNDSIIMNKKFKLLGLLFYLMFFIIILEVITGKNVVTIVSLASILAPLLLAIATNKLRTFGERLKRYVFEDMLHKNNEFILFTAIGFFGYSLKISDASNYIAPVLSKIGASANIFLIPFLIFIIVGLSMIGMHPIITIATIAAISPLKIWPITEKALVGVYLVGYTLYSMLSPFSATNLIVSEVNACSPLQVGLKTNFAFGIAFTVLASLLLYLF